MYRELLKRKLAENEQTFEFKATPFVDAEPFIPKASNKPPVVPDDIVLATDIRLEERKLFELELLEKEQLRQKMLMDYEKQQKEKEKEEIKKLRKKMEFKANPIRSFASVSVNPSSKKLTVPYSPSITKKNKQEWKIQDV